MSKLLEVIGLGAQLKIEILNYENPKAEHTSDANWLNCRVAIEAGVFLGNFTASFTTWDFLRFLNELHAVLSDSSGTASFSTYEDSVQLTVDLRKTGLVQISGTVQVFSQVQTSLSFTFESDQSFLRQTYSQLETVVSEYPVKT